MRIPFIPYIPMSIALSALTFSQASISAELPNAPASMQNVSNQRILPDGSDDVDSGSKELSPRCMLKPYEAGCPKPVPTEDQLALGVDMAIASGQLGGIVSPLADINAAIAMQQIYGSVPPVS